MIQFYDLDDAPPDVQAQSRPAVIPLAERPLVCPLPRPPVCWLGGVEYVLERVEIRDLEAWGEQRGLVPVRGANLGQHGLVTVYGYDGKGGTE